MRRRPDGPPSLLAWSATVGSLSIATSATATAWLPWPWSVAAWAVLAVVLCTVGGLLYPVGDSDGEA